MAKTGKVLSIDINNESITIVEVTPSEKKQTYIHKVLIFETPEDSFEDGVIRDIDRIAAEIRTQLATNGISNKNAIFVMNSQKVINREVTIASDKPKKIREIIQANASDYFPVSIEDYIVSSSVLEEITTPEGQKQLRVMAVAAPEAMVHGYYDLGNAAGLKVVAIDYIGNSMLQLIKTQTNEQSTAMVIQLGSESTVLNVVQGKNLLLQRTVPYGTNPVVNVVMEEKGVDATTAMTLLQNDRIITVDFDDNEATGAFRYLINNIGRVMDYYASNHPDAPIDDVFLTGDGALIRGIDGLFKIQLNVSTRIMDTLFNVKFDPSIDQKIYSPVYLIAPIGAALSPMGFEIMQAKSQSKGEIGFAPFIAILAVGLIASGGLAFYISHQKSVEQDNKAALERQIKEKEYIETIIQEHDAAQAKALDIAAMSLSTYSTNEQCLAFINELEEKIPTNVIVQSFAASDTGITIPCTATNYDEIADFIVQLKTISCIQDVYVASVNKELKEDGTESFIYTLTCTYTNPFDIATESSDDSGIVTE